MRIGHGYDAHRLVAGRPLILGGAQIPYERGLDGHSDADVLTHAVMDAMLGAACLGDIGKMFPDNDPETLGISSMILLDETAAAVAEAGFTRPVSAQNAKPALQGAGSTGRPHQREGNHGGAYGLYRPGRGNRRARSRASL